MEKINKCMYISPHICKGSVEGPVCSMDYSRSGIKLEVRESVHSFLLIKAATLKQAIPDICVYSGKNGLNKAKVLKKMVIFVATRITNF